MWNVHLSIRVSTVRCSDISKCMVKVYDSNEHVGCNIPVTLVEKLDELDPQQGLTDDVLDCSQDPNLYFRKRLLKVCGITSAVTIVFYSITILLHYLFVQLSFE
ncbi:hypothetical protein RF11_15048 [Thelohanellus kitauei]|uniref:Uncharacterized protein n=1 Tax=Thelohanellus kitauei TaxID=669202 RepID=A0A0C2IET0_THEKT|nr:hypothetical protein RF11_15048 [Thelohanellus kitauei]